MRGLEVRILSTRTLLHIVCMIFGNSQMLLPLWVCSSWLFQLMATACLHPSRQPFPMVWTVVQTPSWPSSSGVLIICNCTLILIKITSNDLGVRGNGEMVIFCKPLPLSPDLAFRYGPPLGVPVFVLSVKLLHGIRIYFLLTTALIMMLMSAKEGFGVNRRRTCALALLMVLMFLHRLWP